MECICESIVGGRSSDIIFLLIESKIILNIMRVSGVGPSVCKDKENIRIFQDNCSGIGDNSPPTHLYIVRVVTKLNDPIRLNLCVATLK